MDPGVEVEDEDPGVEAEDEDPSGMEKAGTFGSLLLSSEDAALYKSRLKR